MDGSNLLIEVVTLELFAGASRSQRSANRAEWIAEVEHKLKDL